MPGAIVKGSAMKELADGITVAALAGGGVWIKWAAAPVLIAFELGRLFERIKLRGQKAARRGARL
jgi:hypothetical protein